MAIIISMKTRLTYLKKMELFKELDLYREGEFYAIIDQKVKNHVPQWIQFSTKIFWLSNPEEQKNLEDFDRALQFFLKQGLHRKSKLYAIGGGATTDFAGFVASSILRGIPWIAIPTTLLAMIDASIGGKVGLNMPQGKNLVGAFHAPQDVFVCTDFLNTLSAADWLSGKGEMLKYGFLSKEIHNMILKKTSIDDIAAACATFKANLVESDFLERDNRILLNLGHTLGHAFEHTLKIPHGQAVAMGMKHLFLVMGLDDAHNELMKMAEALEIPEAHLTIKNHPHFKLETFFAALEQDKKRIQSKLQLVLVGGPGTCYVQEIGLKEFKTKIEGHHVFSGANLT